MRKYLDDVFLIIGLGVIAYATFRWSTTGGWYVLGFALILLAVGIGVNGKKGNDAH